MRSTTEFALFFDFFAVLNNKVATLLHLLYA